MRKITFKISELLTIIAAKASIQWLNHLTWLFESVPINTTTKSIWRLKVPCGLQNELKSRKITFLLNISTTGYWRKINNPFMKIRHYNYRCTIVTSVQLPGFLLGSEKEWYLNQKPIKIGWVCRGGLLGSQKRWYEAENAVARTTAATRARPRFWEMLRIQWPYGQYGMLTFVILSSSQYIVVPNNLMRVMHILSVVELKIWAFLSIGRSRM